MTTTKRVKTEQDKRIATIVRAIGRAYPHPGIIGQNPAVTRVRVRVKPGETLADVVLTDNNVESGQAVMTRHIIRGGGTKVHAYVPGVIAGFTGDGAMSVRYDGGSGEEIYTYSKYSKCYIIGTRYIGDFEIFSLIIMTRVREGN